MGLVALCVSIVALVVSGLRQWSATKANLIAESSPWLTLILQHVHSELLAAYEERSIYAGLCLPFKSLEEKREQREKLRKARDESAKRLFVIRALLGEGVTLHAAQVKNRLDTIEDSYFENQELEISKQRSEAISSHYLAVSEEYVDALRSVGMDMTKSRGLLFSKAKKKKVLSGQTHGPPQLPPPR